MEDTSIVAGGVEVCQDLPIMIIFDMLRTMNKGLIIGLVVVAVLAIGGFMFMSSQKSASTSEVVTDTNAILPMDTPSTTMAATGGAVMTTGAIKEFTVEGSSFKFAPAEMKVKKGDTVKITFKNTGGMHDFVIDELDVKTNQIQGGDEETVEFVADKAGTFEYYCSVGQHRQMGMKGNLIVE